MRSAHVLIAPLTGVATEVVKNIVLSGIGRLTIADGASVSEEDLGAGFFFRADDVGSPRAAAAPLQRIQQLNPLVQLQGITERDVLADAALVEELRPDVVVACAGEREALVQLNAASRRIGARFYATRAQGLGGFLFSDLGERYEYVTERSERGSTEKKKALWRQAFVPLADSLRVSWNRAGLQPGEVLGAPVRQWSAGLWALWASWELGAEARSSPEAYAAALEQTALRLLDAKGVEARSVFDKRGVDRATFFRYVRRAPACTDQERVRRGDLRRARGRVRADLRGARRDPRAGPAQCAQPARGADRELVRAGRRQRYVRPCPAPSSPQALRRSTPSGRRQQRRSPRRATRRTSRQAHRPRCNVVRLAVESTRPR